MIEAYIVKLVVTAPVGDIIEVKADGQLVYSGNDRAIVQRWLGYFNDRIPWSVIRDEEKRRRMVKKDWIQDAANEIIEQHEPEPFSGYYHQVIERHCPFELDVAYMPVPRCDQCKHWTRGKIPGSTRLSIGGVCSNPELRAYGIGLLDVSPMIETAESFGCVQWEEK